MHTFELLLILVAASLALAYAAQRLQVPLAVALVIGGMALAFVPGLSRIELDPELALALFLPPLLQASAYHTDWTAFRANLRPILLLAVGLVFFTTAAVAVVAKLLVPGLPWWAAVTLGAIVAPPDAVAAGAVLKRLRLPKRLTTVIEGESLINDAASLVLYRLAVTATLAGTFDIGSGLLQFAGTAVGGIVTGWLIARLAMLIFALIEDTLLDITTSLLAGFMAYLFAEHLGASGVLAAVTCGMVLGRRQHSEFTGESRLALAAVWNFVEFILTALVFMLIGLQLRGIVERLEDYNPWRLALLGGAVALTLIATRFLWIVPATWLPRMLSPRLRARDPMPSWGSITVLSWAGMRGVVSLAAALALPLRFPGRDIIVFLAFCAIFATLVVQGTTLGWLTRKLGAEEPAEGGTAPELVQARAEMAAASLKAVEEHAHVEEDHADAAREVVDELSAQAERSQIEGDDHDATVDQLAAQQRLRLVAIDAARATLAERTDTLDTETHRALAEELDLQEQQVRRALGEGAG